MREIYCILFLLGWYQVRGKYFSVIYEIQFSDKSLVVFFKSNVKCSKKYVGQTCSRECGYGLCKVYLGIKGKCKRNIKYIIIFTDILTIKIVSSVNRHETHVYELSEQDSKWNY